VTEIGRTLWMASPTDGVPATLMIAEGTEWETLVYDARQLGPWAKPTPGDVDPAQRDIIYHHTVAPPWAGQGWEYQLDAMERMRNEAPWGLPYNFVVFPTGRGRIWYLNDVDQRWPHTWAHNEATAIAAWGNFSLERPTRRLVGKMLKLADALASMWGRYIPESQHRDWYATECPGNNLSPHLPRAGQRREGATLAAPYLPDG